MQTYCDQTKYNIIRTRAPRSSESIGREKNITSKNVRGQRNEKNPPAAPRTPRYRRVRFYIVFGHWFFFFFHEFVYLNNAHGNYVRTFRDVCVGKKKEKKVMLRRYTFAQKA